MVAGVPAVRRQRKVSRLQALPGFGASTSSIAGENDSTRIGLPRNRSPSIAPRFAESPEIVTSSFFLEPARATRGRIQLELQFPRAKGS